MAVFMFIVLVSFLSTTSGQGSHNQMRGNRDLSSSDVVKEDNSKVASTAGNKQLQAGGTQFSRGLFYTDSLCSNLEYGIAFELDTCYQYYQGGSDTFSFEQWVKYTTEESEAVDGTIFIYTTGQTYSDSECTDKSFDLEPVLTAPKECSEDYGYSKPPSASGYYVIGSTVPASASSNLFPTNDPSYTIVSDYSTKDQCSGNPTQSYYLKTGVCQTAPYSSLSGSYEVKLSCSGGKLTGTNCDGAAQNFKPTPCGNSVLGSAVSENVDVCAGGSPSSAASSTRVVPFGTALIGLVSLSMMMFR